MDRKGLLGKRIQGLRKGRRLSQEMLAERAGISTQYLSNIERGKENPTLDMLFTLADALKVGLADLCDYEPVGNMDRKRLQRAVRELIANTDPERLKTTLKVLKSIVT